MKRYSTVHPLFMSFYSRSLYQDVATNWRKTSFIYLLLLIAVCVIPLTFKTRATVSDYLLREAPKIIKQFPAVSISKGQVSADVTMPYTIRIPESNRAFFVIDTTGQVTSLTGSEAMILLTKTKLILKSGSNEPKTWDLSEIDGLLIDQSKLYDWMDTFLEYFPVVIFPIALFFTFLFRTVQSIIYSMIAISFNKYIKLNLKYAALLSLSVVSMTPAIVLDTVYNYFDVTIPFWWLIDFAIAFAYLIFALKSTARQGSSNSSKNTAIL
ncbi:MAG TPA: DUF1189 family protein [Thermodesulfovibrionales bacterium]|nr:DUF1189 family protein [Thermodesulfovibrionales bacterium]